MAKAPIDPFKIFLHAYRFLIAEEHLRRTEDPQMMSFIAAPSIVLSAFASELFFKCIQVLEKGNASSTHNLAVLFKGVSSSAQKKIIGHWDKSILNHEKQFALQEAMSGQKIPRDLPTALNICGRAFDGMRYIYEDPLSTNFYLIDLPRILHAVIVEVKPDWMGLGPAPATEIKP